MGQNPLAEQGRALCRRRPRFAIISCFPRRPRVTPMCTIVLLRRPGHDWPLILGANRDEMATRPSKPPARHWPDRAGVVAGLDVEAGGSWLGLKDAGLTAAVLNRHRAPRPPKGFRSRGGLVLGALALAPAAASAPALQHLHPPAP